MKAGKDDKSKCTVQAKAGRNVKVVFATLSPLGFLFPMGLTVKFHSLYYRYEGYIDCCTGTDFGLLGLDRFVIFRDGAFSDNYETSVVNYVTRARVWFLSTKENF